NDPAYPGIYSLSLHDALPISRRAPARRRAICSIFSRFQGTAQAARLAISCGTDSKSSHTMRSPWARMVEPELIANRAAWAVPWRSEEHTSELQSRGQLVCRLL